MSDLMLHAVLEMPANLWSGDVIDVIQRHSRYLEASERIKSDAEIIATLQSRIKEQAWISVNESLPECDHLVAISWHGVDEVQCDYMDIDVHYGTQFWANNQDDPPDSWFFIPSPPEAN